MKSYLSSPYLSQIQANILDRKKIDQSIHIRLDHTIFCPSIGSLYEADRGFIDHIAVERVYEKNGEIYHVLNTNPDKNQVDIYIDRKHRVTQMKSILSLYLIKEITEQVFRLKVEQITNQDGALSALIRLKNPNTNADSLVENIFSTANRLVASHFMIDKEKLDNGRLQCRIPTLNPFTLTCPFPRDTREAVTLLPLRQERQNGHLRVSFVSADHALRQFKKSYQQMRALEMNMDCHSTDIIPAVYQQQKDNIELQNKLKNMTDYCYSIELSKLSKHISDGHLSYQVEDPVIIDALQLVEKVPSPSFLLYWSVEDHISYFIVTTDRPELEKLFDELSDIYPLTITPDERGFLLRIHESYHNRLLTQLENFLDRK